MKWIWIPSPLVILCQMALGQTPQGSSFTIHNDSLQAVSMSFERLLNTFTWNGLFLLKGQLNGLAVDMDQRLRSRLIRTGQISIQDEYEGKLRLSSSLTDHWNLQASVASHVLSDARAVDLARLGQHQILGGVGYSSDNNTTVSALGGLEINSQEYERDQGFSYRTALRAPEVSVEEMRGSLTSSVSQSFLGRRKPEHRNATVKLVRSFGPGTSDSLSVEYDKLRREFYVKASPSVQAEFQTSNNIFIRDAEVLDIFNQLNYRMGESSRFSLQGGLLRRTITRWMYYQGSAGSQIADPRIQESQLYGGLSLANSLDTWISTNIGMSLSEREEAHATRILNNVSRRSALTGDLFLTLSNDDSLKIGGSASLFRYDTPDSLNTDDRDELYFTFGLEEIHRFSPSLTLTLSADVALNHLVYLHRFQSASNNWNRVIRFSPKVMYEPSSWFRSTVQAEVLANYTVYDFEDQIASIRSFSFRQASWSDSTVIQSGRWELVVLGSVRLSERGILRWKEFQERPENFFIDKDFWPQVFFRPMMGLRIGFGYRFFSQDRFKYSAGERILDLKLQNSGPTAVFQLFDEGMERVSIEGWSETQTVNGISLASISNLTMRVSLTL